MKTKHIIYGVFGVITAVLGYQTGMADISQLSKSLVDLLGALVAGK